MTDQEIKDKLKAIHAQNGGEKNCIQVIIMRLPCKHRAPGSVDTTCDLCGRACCFVQHEIEDKCRKYGYGHYVKMCSSCLKIVMPDDANPVVLHNHHAAKATGATQAKIIAIEKMLAASIGAAYQDPAENN